MTCCIAISINNCSLAAADTRIGLEHDGTRTNHDGPHSLSVDVASLGRTLTLPYRYRKIRLISDGWAVCAGEFASATSILDLLKQHGAILFTQARGLLVGNEPLLRRVTSETGIAREQLLETVILGAPRGTATAGWTLSLRPGDGRTHRRVDGFSISWPHAVPQKDRTTAEAALRSTLQNSNSSTLPLEYAKAMGRVISVAARFAPDVGPFIQIGETVTAATQGSRSIYFEGLTDELLSLNEPDFKQRCEVAA